MGILIYVLSFVSNVMVVVIHEINYLSRRASYENGIYKIHENDIVLDTGNGINIAFGAIFIIFSILTVIYAMKKCKSKKSKITYTVATILYLFILFVIFSIYNSCA